MPLINEVPHGTAAPIAPPFRYANDNELYFLESLKVVGKKCYQIGINDKNCFM